MVISHGHKKSMPEICPGFRCWRALANSLAVKFPEIFTRSDVDAFQRLKTLFATNLEDSLLNASYLPFSTY